MHMWTGRGPGTGLGQGKQADQRRGIAPIDTILYNG